MASNNKKKILGMDHDQFNMFMGKYGIGIILIGMVIIIAIMKPLFIKPNNLLNIFTQISINGLIAYGMCRLTARSRKLYPRPARRRKRMEPRAFLHHRSSGSRSVRLHQRRSDFQI